MKTAHLILLAIFFATISLAQTNSGIKCRIWQMDSLCSLPKGINIPSHYSCEDCTWDFISCEHLNKKHYKAVWITFKKEIDTTFVLETNFKNITLTNKITKKTIYPSAILWYHEYPEVKPSELDFMSSVFKAKKYIVSIKPKESTDLLLFFNKAEIGDNISIENFLETEIQN
jgi:hypothetical protein